MKKSKIVLVTVLAFVLCFVCLATQTFSWFTLPRSMNGDSLQWSESAYNASTGSGITIATYESTDDGKTFGETAITNLSNSSTGIAAGKRKYYRTDITNSSQSAQSVSLYFSTLGISSGSSGNFFLGVNSPLRTYKEYGTSGSQKVSSTVNQRNVYVGFNTSQSYTPTNYQVHWWDQNNSDSYKGDANVSSYLNKTGNYLNSTYNMAYATIPWDANGIRLRSGNSWFGSGDNTNVSKNNTICVYLWDNATQAEYVESDKAAGINTFYSSATVSKGATTNIAASGQGTITYSSSNTSVATVSTSGVVTGVNAGTATITVKSQGLYGDTITSTCQVTVAASGSAFNDVPIATNVRVAPRTAESNTVESIYWYIKNDSTTGPLKYTITDLYVTL